MITSSVDISDAEFARVRALAMRLAGINIAPAKRAMVVSRWAQRRAHYLAVRFGRQPQPLGKKACILIIDSYFKQEKHVLGVVVDTLSEVVTIATTGIEPAPAFGGSIRSEFLQGLARIRGRFVALLAAGSVFDMSQLAALVAEAGGASAELPAP